MELKKIPTNKILPLAALAAVLLILGLAALRPKADATLIGKDIKAYRIVQDGQPTSAAHVSVPFTRKADDLTVANVAIDLNRDGTFAAYKTADGGDQEEWVVKNMRAKVIEAGNTFSFDLVDRAVDAAKDFPLEAVLTASPLKDWAGGVSGKGALTKVVISSFETEDFGPLFKADPTGERDGAAGDGPTPGPMASTKTKFPDAEKFLRDTTAPESEGAGEAAAIGAEPAAAGGGLPPPGSDFSVFQPGVPDMLQGTNECAPTSASNGIHSLARRYGFEDKLPASQRDSMNELKTDMNWHAEGVATRTDFIPGKVAFTRRHDLPIYTHQIGGELDADITRKIAAELAKGQAVEVIIGYYTQDAAGAWTRHGGHVMSGVGAFGQDGHTYLGVHDPLSPESGRLDMYEIDGTRVFNYRYRGNSMVFIDRAFAQSVTAEWIAAHPPSAALDTTSLVESQNFHETMLVDTIQIGQAWYPVMQFHQGTGPECENKMHWHANSGLAWGVDRTGFQPFELSNPEKVYRSRNDVKSWKDPDGCGAGKVADVVHRTILITNDEAGKLVAGIVK
jgi:hypothetical protein